MNPLNEFNGSFIRLLSASLKTCVVNATHDTMTKSSYHSHAIWYSGFSVERRALASFNYYLNGICAFG